MSKVNILDDSALIDSESILDDLALVNSDLVHWSVRTFFIGQFGPQKYFSLSIRTSSVVLFGPLPPVNSALAIKKHTHSIHNLSFSHFSSCTSEYSLPKHSTLHTNWLSF